MQEILTVVPFSALMSMDTITSMPEQAVGEKGKLSVNTVKINRHNKGVFFFRIPSQIKVTAFCQAVERLIK